MQPLSNFRHTVCSKGPPQTSAVHREGSGCVIAPERSLVGWSDCSRKEERKKRKKEKTKRNQAGKKWSANGVHEKKQ